MIIQCPNCQARYNTAAQVDGDAIQCRCGIELQIPNLPDIARSWNCPNCSGSVDPNKSRCEYCDAYIVFARCPACFSIAAYNDAKHCAECGELLILPIKPLSTHESKHPCPRCISSLKVKVIDAHLVDYCSDCGGVWLSHNLLNGLMKSVPPNSIAALGNPPSKGFTKLPYHEVRYLRCPDCDRTMGRHNFMYSSNVIVDQCLEHGVWFDKHELAVALDYARSTLDKTLLVKRSVIEKEVITRRDGSEVFEIKDEDLQLLLEEFPHWVAKESRK